MSLNVSERVHYDLKLNQKALWFIHALGGNAQSVYNESLIYSLQGYLSINALKSAFAAIHAKHEILRTAFTKDQEGNLLQYVQERVDPRLTVISNGQNLSLTEYIEDEIRKPFDLNNAPLLRVSVIKLKHDHYMLIIVVHHIITDGTSLQILINDLNHFYNRILSGEMIENIPSGATYFDSVTLEKNIFVSEKYAKNVATMSQTLKGYEGLNFLTTPIEGDNNDIYSGNRVYFTIDHYVYEKMQAFCKAQGATLFHFIFSAYCIFLNQFTRSEDLVVGVPFANRKNQLERNIMGFFVNTLPLRVFVDKQKNFVELLSSIKTAVFSLLETQDVVLEHITEKMNLQRRYLGQHPFIQTMFVWGSTEKLKLVFDGITAQLEQKYFSKTAKFDLSLFMLEDNKENIIAYFEYRDFLFNKALIQSFANCLTTLIINILANPKGLISSFSMLKDEERSRIKDKFFISKLDRVVNTSLAELFSQTANKYRERIGLVYGSKQYNYDALEKRSNQWASYIRFTYQQIYGCEMPSDALIALCVDRNEDMIFGMLGILKSGGAYVPIDPHYPPERIHYIATHSKACLLLSHRKHSSLLKNFSVDRIIFMDDDAVQVSPHFVNRIHQPNIDPKSIAYVLYTSGSTGTPKGVAVTHENIICLFESLKKQFVITCEDVWSLFHTFCFDISVWEIWGAFLFGGKLIIIPYEVSRDPHQFYQLIASEGVTVLTQTASAFQMFINEDLRTNTKLQNLKYIAFVGESLKVSILRAWVKKYGTIKPLLANMYGITETTVYTNYKFIDQHDINKGRDNIGWPLEEFSMCIMDDNLQWCPVGIVGEICIGGRGLSRGYLYREDLTQEKFIPDPYASFLGLHADTKLYRTGDLGRWMEDGSIEYLGRKDFQVKLRGYRIELGEIESALGSYKGISHTAVLLKGEGESAYLAAYYTVESGNRVEVTKLALHLQTFLPEYMIPKTFTELSAFPMTINGKIDRKILYTCEDKISVAGHTDILHSPLEYDIAAIWSELLNIDINGLGSSSNFFAVGGNSLLVIKMLTLVSRKIGKELSLGQFIGSPTIATLAGQRATVNINHNFHHFWQRLDQDRILDVDIQPLHECNPSILHPKAILLTGVTGFLGAHILHELLERTNAEIYCLARAASNEEALKRIIEKLQKYHLLKQETLIRIIPMVADLNEDRLGLSDGDYDLLSKTVDSIFHVGAWVHHIFDYSTLYKTNVQSTREILNLAICKKNKAVHFVSTLSTQLISPEKLPVMTDDGSLETLLHLNGYLTSKWVAEQLLQQAWSRGIVAHVYRPGNIVAGSQGIYEPENNHTLLRLKGLLQLKKAYLDSKETLEMMPVDLLASAIVEISNHPKLFSYNLNNAHSISWIEYLNIAKKHGYVFTLLRNQEEWNTIINNLDEQNSLYKLAHLYKIPSMCESQISQELNTPPDHIITTPSYDVMIEQQLSSLIASGFLPTPEEVHETVNL